MNNISNYNEEYFNNLKKQSIDEKLYCKINVVEKIFSKLPKSAIVNLFKMEGADFYKYVLGCIGTLRVMNNNNKNVQKGLDEIKEAMGFNDEEAVEFLKEQDLVDKLNGENTIKLVCGSILGKFKYNISTDNSSSFLNIIISIIKMLFYNPTEKNKTISEDNIEESCISKQNNSNSFKNSDVKLSENKSQVKDENDFANKLTICNSVKSKLIYSKIVGVTFNERQNLIKQCYIAQILTLKREYDNEYDNNSIAVHSELGKLGYISKDLANELAILIDNGVKIKCVVEQITGTLHDNTGINISLSYNQDKKILKESNINNKVIKEEKELEINAKNFNDNNIFSNPINEDTLLSLAFKEKSPLNENGKASYMLSDKYKELICTLVESSAKEYIMAGVKSVNFNIDNILQVKRKREKTNYMYEISLKKNCLFYMYKWVYTKNLLRQWITYKLIPSLETTTKHLNIIREECMTEYDGNKIILRNRKPIQGDILVAMNKVDLIKSNLERIDNLEFEYKFLSVRDDILYKVILCLSDNSKVLENMYNNIDINSFVQYLESTIFQYTSMAIGNTKFELSHKINSTK